MAAKKEPPVCKKCGGRHWGFQAHNSKRKRMFRSGFDEFGVKQSGFFGVEKRTSFGVEA